MDIVVLSHVSSGMVHCAHYEVNGSAALEFSKKRKEIGHYVK